MPDSLEQILSACSVVGVDKGKEKHSTFFHFLG